MAKNDLSRYLISGEFASDSSWKEKQGRKKGLRADLPGNLEYLWRASSGDLLLQNDLFRLQHVMHAITLTDVNYDVLSETEWEGRHAVRLSPDIPRCFLRKADIDAGFEEDGNQVKPVAVRTTADPAAVDTLLSRAGWTRKPDTASHYLHYLFTVSQEE